MSYGGIVSRKVKQHPANALVSVPKETVEKLEGQGADYIVARFFENFTKETAA